MLRKLLCALGFHQWVWCYLACLTPDAEYRRVDLACEHCGLIVDTQLLCIDNEGNEA